MANTKITADNLAANAITSASIADNSIGITQLNVSDGTNGQVLTTNGSGTLSFSTISGYTDSDVETYLDGGTSTPTFASATVTGNIAVSGTVDGRDLATDGTKLDGIESGATADQTASEILTLIKTVDGAGSGLDADTLDGISSASFLRSDADDTLSGNLTVTGNLTVQGTTTTLETATLNVEDKNITINYSTGDSSGSADGAGITIQDAVNSTTDATILWDATNDEFDFSHAINVTGNISTSGTVDGRDIASDGSKLDGIESGATADQTAAEILTAIKTVDGAGSGLDADLLDGQSSAYYQPASSALTTSTSFGGDVSGTYNAIVVADDSHNHIISNVDGLQAALDAKLASSSYTAADVLTKIKTVDGAGSGLDADLLDGISSASFLRSDAADTFGSQLTSANNVAIRFAAANATDTNDGKIGAGLFNTGLNIVGAQTSAGTGRQVRIWGEVITDSGNKYWHAGNDGAGSGLDADLLDGISSASFLRSDATDTFTTLSGTQLNLGSQVQLKESSERGDLLEISSATTGWAGLQIRNTSNEGRWSFMTDGGVAGIYDDENNDWHIYMTENAGVDLRYNGLTKFNTTSAGIDVTGNITVSGTVDGVDIAARDAVLTSTTTTANAALPKAGGTMTGNLTMSGASIYPATDNTGQIGNGTNTWNFGHFTNLQVDNTLTVRVYIDLADSDGIRWGSSDDYRMFYNGSTNYMNFEMEAANNGLIFTDNGTTRYTFSKAGTLSLETNGNNTNGGNIRLGSTQNNATKFTSITSREYTNNTETEGFTIIGSVATTERSIIVGGGYLEQNAANNIKFYTTSGTARTGTEIARFTTNGLTFNGDTAAANALDDYEEGTWTPVNEGGTTGGASSLQGRYTKIGRMVYAHFSFETTGGVDTGLNYRVISGLPFVTYANSPIGQLGNCSMYNLDAYRSGYILNNSSGNNTEIFCAWNQTTSTGSLFRGFLIYETT
jgi:hypothetical protein